MILKLYSVKDKLMDFTGPLAFKDEKVAIRWFESECKRKHSIEFTSTRYYELYHVGYFDPETGVITALTQSEIRLVKEGEEYDEQTNEG